MSSAIEKILSCVKVRNVCLQAGGAFGAYPIALASYFKEVVTIEADPRNFADLSRAIAKIPNIRSVNAGLWDSFGRGSTQQFRNGHRMTEYICPGDDFDLVTMDSLNVRPDLIWLDIEGSEFRALSGGLETLKHCKYVCIEEGKNLEVNVGSAVGSAGELLRSLGYAKGIRVELDTLYARP